MKAVDIRTVDKSQLVDLSTVHIDESLPVRERVLSYLKQVKNPYCVRVGNFAVKVKYKEDGPSFEEVFKHLLQQMLEHFLKGWPVLFVFHLDSKVAHSDTVWILHLLQITEHSFTHRQGFINVNGAQVYKLRLVYCPNINRLHRFPLLGCDISWM